MKKVDIVKQEVFNGISLQKKVKKKKAVFSYISSSLIKDLDSKIDLLLPYLKDRKRLKKKDREILLTILSHISERSKVVKGNFTFIYLNLLKTATVIHIEGYLKFLIDNSLIERDSFYIVGQKPYYYRLPNKYYSSLEFEEVKVRKIFTDKPKKYKKLKDRSSKLTTRDYKKIRENNKKLRFDFYKWKEDVKKQVKDKVKRKEEFRKIKSAKRKDNGYFSRSGEGGRVYNVLTSLSKEHRKYLRGDLYSIDIKNCHPFLLGHLKESLQTDFKKFAIDYLGKEKFNIIKDFKLSKVYLDLVDRGVFYDESSINKECYFPTIYSKNSTRNSFKSEYKEKFPNEYSLGYKIKKGNHILLPVLLQRLESYVFIDVIVKRLLGLNLWHLTLHDSIICSKEDVVKIEIIMKESFEDVLNKSPQFNVKVFNNSYI